MDRLALLMICLFCLVCCSPKLSDEKKNNNTIVYMLPGPVEEILQKNPVQVNDSAFFMLETLDSANLKLSVLHFERSRIFPLAAHTNRKVFLNARFFPLIFDYDMLFAGTESAKEVMRKAAASKYWDYDRSRPVYHYFFYITFRRYQGAVIASGTEGAD